MITSEEDDFMKFKFEYFPSNFKNECMKIPILSEFQSHIDQIELDKKTYIDNSLKKKYKSAKINNYDIIICEQWAFKSNDEISMYQFICKNLIFNDSEVDEQLLLCALRLLYICPMCIHHLQTNELQVLTDKLMDWAVNKEEPFSSHSIKCLQVVAYSSSKKGRVVQNFNHLAKVVIDRLLILIDKPDENYLVPIDTLNHQKPQPFQDNHDIGEIDETFNESEYKNSRTHLNICTYIDIGQISNSSSQKFHHMALLNYIVMHISADEISENTNLIELINKCITRKETESLALRCFALSIICRYANHVMFMIKLIEKKCLDRVFSIPCNFSSNFVVFKILKIITTNIPLLDYIIENDENYIVWILQYAIKMYSVSNNLDMHNFLISLLTRSPFWIFFQKINGIKQIFNQIKKRSLYILMTTGTFDEDTFDDFLNINRKNVIFISKILRDHIFTFMCSITPSYILNSISSDNISNASFEHFNTIFEYYQKIGGIRHDVHYFDTILEIDSFNVILIIARILCEFDMDLTIQDDRKMRTFCDVLCVLKSLSLYHKSNFAFMNCYDPYPCQTTRGNNLIFLFRSVVELCKGCELYFEVLPFEIYTNLLMFLFSDTESYRSFMFSIDEKGSAGSNTISCNENNMPCLQLINLLQENSIVHHTLEILSMSNKTKQCVLAKISSIKCLILLTNVNKARKTICALRHQIEKKIEASLIGMMQCEEPEKDSLIFFRYAFKLIELIDVNSKISDSRTFNDIGKNTYSENFYALSLISQHYPDEFLTEDVKKFERELLKSKKENLHSRNSNILYVANIFRIMIKSLPENSKISPTIPPRIKQMLTNPSVTLMSYSSFDKIKPKKIIQRNQRASAYKNFKDIKTYKSIEENQYIYSAKILNDDNIIYTYSCGIRCVSENGSTYSHTSSSIHYIDTSPDGQLLIGGGLLDGHETRFVDLWRYNQSDNLKNIQPSRNWNDLNWAKISRDNKNIFGMNRMLTVKMFDIEKNKLIRDFYNKTAKSFARINSIEMDGSENIILFNGDLFCIRSGKLINTFDRFSPHVSGIFMPSSLEVLINTELWDLRTFNLLETIPHLKDIVVKRTLNDNILFGESIKDYHNIYYEETHFCMWENFNSLLGEYVSLYDCRDLSQLTKSEFEGPIMFANLSENCSKLAIGFDDFDQEYTSFGEFKIMSI